MSVRSLAVPATVVLLCAAATSSCSSTSDTTTPSGNGTGGTNGSCTYSTDCTGTSSCVKGTCTPNAFFGRIFAATSYQASTEPVFEITDGTARQFATVSANGWVGPIVITPDAHMWVLTHAQGGAVYDITSGGDLTTATPVVSALFSSIGYINGAAMDTAGNLYIANSENGPQQLVKVATDKTKTTLTTAFDNPESLLVEEGTLYVSEAGAGKVWKHDVATGNETVFASGFVAGPDHVSAQLAIDAQKHLWVFWQTGGGQGLFDITAGGDFSAATPAVALAGAFRVDVNQVAVSQAGDFYVAGATSGSVWVSKKGTSGLGAFTSFATGLGDCESVAIFHR